MGVSEKNASWGGLYKTSNTFRFFLLRVEINFNPRIYLKNNRTRLLYDPDDVDFVVIS